MIIQLNEQYRITTIPNNFCLEEKVITKEGKRKGEECWKNVGYYCKLEHALVKLFKKGLQESEVEGIQNIISEIKTSVKIIMEQIKLLQDEHKKLLEEVVIELVVAKENLDIKLNETETLREFIRNTEKEFGFAEAELEFMTDEQFKEYVNLLNDLWDK